MNSLQDDFSSNINYHYYYFHDFSAAICLVWSRIKILRLGVQHVYMPTTDISSVLRFMQKCK